MPHSIIELFREEGKHVVGTAPLLAIEHGLSLLISELGDAVGGELGEETVSRRLDRLEAFALLLAARLENLAETTQGT